MSLTASLDRLSAPERSAAEQLREALALFDEGVEMKRLNLKRQFPEASEAELHAKLVGWLARDDEEHHE